jgi:hypothetical protein
MSRGVSASARRRIFSVADEQIKNSAYGLYEQRRKQDGGALDDWLQAEPENYQRIPFAQKLPDRRPMFQSVFLPAELSRFLVPTGPEFLSHLLPPCPTFGELEASLGVCLARSKLLDYE